MRSRHNSSAAALVRKALVARPTWLETLLSRWEIVAINTDRLVLQKRDMEYLVDGLHIPEVIEGEGEQLPLDLETH
jgi:hypothetical protein